MAGIGVVVNPRAGGNRRAADRAERLGRVLGESGWVRVVTSVEGLPEFAAECRERSVDVLAVCGGDGTYGRTLSAFVRSYGGAPLPRFLPLRAGTMNTVARAMGCPSWQPERMLAEVAAEYRSGRPLASFEHQLLCIDGNSYGFMFGAGVIVGFLRAYYDHPRSGRRGAVEVLARLIASAVIGGGAARRAFEWVDATLLCDGVKVPFDRYSVIYASSIEEIGLGFRPTYRAREQRGRFHVFAGPVHARELVRRLGRIRRGLPTGSPQVFDATAKRLEVRFASPCTYMMDGDIFSPAEKLGIEPGPILRVIGR